MLPDLILLDVMMPGMDGYRVCEALRTNRELMAVPIIMVTALDDADSRIKGLNVGADDFITKPFNSAELRARVRSVTRLNRYRKLLEQQEQLAYLTNYDHTTGLPNRTLMRELLQRLIKRLKRRQRKLLVIVIAFEGLQKAHHAFGQRGIDRMLIALSQRIKNAAPEQEEGLARLHGNRLGLIETTRHPERDILAVTERLQTVVDSPIEVEGQKFFAQMRPRYLALPRRRPFRGPADRPGRLRQRLGAAA